MSVVMKVITETCRVH